MSGNKSLGPDDMSPTFYTHFWGTIGEDVTKAVQNFFLDCRMHRAVNHTFLALIPKRAATNRVEQFRPISLCNVIYKVITKILTNRLKPLLDDLIHPSQAAFIPHRSILDNVIINHKIMCYLKSRKGKTGYMAVQVDMTKAYDMVEWDVLFRIMAAHGLEGKFIDLVQACVSTARFSVLVNGSPYGFFPSSRGIRQGDPLSPALFTFLADLLSRILSQAEQDDKISGIKTARTGPRVSHLMYADDLVIYCKADMEETREIKNCLDLYCEWTGQRINWDKSDIHFNSNVPRATRLGICRRLGMFSQY